jgi:hypothetical protein
MPVCVRGTDEEEVRMITEFIRERAPSGQKLMQHNEEMRMITEFIMQIAPSRKLIDQGKLIKNHTLH